MNTTLGQSYTNLPSRTMTWRCPKTKIHMLSVTPGKGGRSNPNAVVQRPYTHFTVNTESKSKLKTKNHTGASYYGLMFSVTALRRPIRITNLHMGSGVWRRELYRVYIKKGSMAGRVVNPTEWDEVAAGETELPAEKGVYGPVPFPVDGVKVQPGRTVSFYVHAPYHVNGCAFRRFAKSWPGYPSFDAITDANADISVGMARATYSQTPFERLSKEGFAFAGAPRAAPPYQLDTPHPSPVLTGHAAPRDAPSGVLCCRSVDVNPAPLCAPPSHCSPPCTTPPHLVLSGHAASLTPY
jgi:hypothetical protein